MTPSAFETHKDGGLRWFRGALELAVVVVFIFLLYQNAELRRRLDTPQRGRAERFAAGDTLPRIPVVDKLGKQTTLELPARRTLVLLADPGCPSCETHLPGLTPDAVILSVAKFETTRASPLSRFSGAVYSVTELPSDARFRKVPQVVVVESGRIVRTCAETRDCT